MKNSGQTRIITIKKESLAQDKMSSVVTLGGYYYGECKLSNIYADRQLKISNNTLNLKIISFSATTIISGILNNFNLKSDTLTNEVLILLMKNDKEKQKFFIDNIKAVTQKKDTVFLNPIILTLTK